MCRFLAERTVELFSETVIAKDAEFLKLAKTRDGTLQKNTDHVPIDSKLVVKQASLGCLAVSEPAGV